MQFLALITILALLSVVLAHGGSHGPTGKGDRCSLPDNCPKPYSCVGKPTNLRCFQKKNLLMRCGKDPFWVCKDKYECIDGICKIPGESGERCDDPRVGCPPPLRCVGNPGNMFCFMGKGKGMMCGDDPEWLCDPKYLCHGGICRCPKKRAEKCEDPLDICVPPLSCVGPEGKKRCYMKKGVGMRCGKDPFWVCEDGLECKCENKKCERKVCKAP